MELNKFKILISDGLAKEGIDKLRNFSNFELTIREKRLLKKIFREIRKEE